MHPKSLRTRSGHLTVGIKRHQMITFKPRLITNVASGLRKPPIAWKVALATKRWEGPDRFTIDVEATPAALIHRDPHAITLASKLQINTGEYIGAELDR